MTRNEQRNHVANSVDVVASGNNNVVNVACGIDVVDVAVDVACGDDLDWRSLAETVAASAECNFENKSKLDESHCNTDERQALELEISALKSTIIHAKQESELLKHTFQEEIERLNTDFQSRLVILLAENEALALKLQENTINPRIEINIFYMYTGAYQ